MKKDRETQELALTTGESNDARLLRLSETPLWSILTDGSLKAHRAAELIAGKPTMLAALRDYATDLDRLVQHANSDGVMVALQPLIVAFQPPKRDRAELPAFYATYQAALKALPFRALKQAVVEYVQNVPFDKWPTIGDLTQRTLKIGQKHMMAEYRAKLALKAHVPPAKPSDEERERVAATVNGLGHEMALSKPPPSSRMVRPSWMDDDQWAAAKADADRGYVPGQKWQGGLSGPQRPMRGTPQQVAESIRSAVPAGDR